MPIKLRVSIFLLLFLIRLKIAHQKYIKLTKLQCKKTRCSQCSQVALQQKITQIERAREGKRERASGGRLIERPYTVNNNTYGRIIRLAAEFNVYLLLQIIHFIVVLLWLLHRLMYTAYSVHRAA